MQLQIEEIESFTFHCLVHLQPLHWNSLWSLFSFDKSENEGFTVSIWLNLVHQNYGVRGWSRATRLNPIILTGSVHSSWSTGKSVVIWWGSVPSLWVKEGLSCVFSRAKWRGKARNLAFPWLQYSVLVFPYSLADSCVGILCFPKNLVKGCVIVNKTATHATFDQVYLDSKLLSAGQYFFLIFSASGSDPVAARPTSFMVPSEPLVENCEYRDKLYKNGSSRKTYSQ